MEDRVCNDLKTTNKAKSLHLRSDTASPYFRNGKSSLLDYVNLQLNLHTQRHKFQSMSCF